MLMRGVAGVFTRQLQIQRRPSYYQKCIPGQPFVSTGRAHAYPYGCHKRKGLEDDQSAQ
jgi:hypothetical protein